LDVTVLDENGEEVVMVENIDYGDADLTPIIEGENNYRYDEGYADAGFSEVTPEEDGADYGMFDDGDMDFGMADEDGYEE
jgi:DNA-directed RNA polymerase subunit beta